VTGRLAVDVISDALRSWCAVMDRRTARGRSLREKGLVL